MTKRWTKTRARAAKCSHQRRGVTALSIDTMTTVATATAARSIRGAAALNDRGPDAALTVRLGEA